MSVKGVLMFCSGGALLMPCALVVAMLLLLLLLQMNAMVQLKRLRRHMHSWREHTRFRWVLVG